jgi:hypothetical protein
LACQDLTRIRPGQYNNTRYPRKEPSKRIDQIFYIINLYPGQLGRFFIAAYYRVKIWGFIVLVLVNRFVAEATGIEGRCRLRFLAAGCGNHVGDYSVGCLLGWIGRSCQGGYLGAFGGERRTVIFEECLKETRLGSSVSQECPDWTDAAAHLPGEFYGSRLLGSEFFPHSEWRALVVAHR